MMDSVLVNELLDEYMYTEAYTVAKNLFCKNPSNKETFKCFADLGLRIASQDIDIEQRKNYLNDISNGLTVFSESSEMTRSLLEDIKMYEENINSVYFDIKTAEQQAILIEKNRIEDYINAPLLEVLADSLLKLRSAKTQTEFDGHLANISKLENELDKDNFSDAQISSYNELTKMYSDTVSKKLEELNREALIETNKEAAESFRKIYNEFLGNKSKYKSKEVNLKKLVVPSLFSYDARDLFNETLVYYNYVYSTIFNEVEDDLKFKLTEWSIDTVKKSVK